MVYKRDGKISHICFTSELNHQTQNTGLTPQAPVPRWKWTSSKISSRFHRLPVVEGFSLRSFLDFGITETISARFKADWELMASGSSDNSTVFRSVEITWSLDKLERSRRDRHRSFRFRNHWDLSSMDIIWSVIYTLLSGTLYREISGHIGIYHIGIFIFGWKKKRGPTAERVPTA